MNMAALHVPNLTSDGRYNSKPKISKKKSHKNVCFNKFGCYLLHSILNRFWTEEVSREIHNTSEHRIQG